MISKVDHMVITTARLPECIAFYKALGFRDSARRKGRNALYKRSPHE